MQDNRSNKNILISKLLENLDKYENSIAKRNKALMILSARYQGICEEKISPISRFPEEDELVEEIIKIIEKTISTFLIDKDLDECEIRDVIARIEYLYWMSNES